MNANFLKAIISFTPLLSLASCSNDDELLLEPKTQSREVISFNVTSDRPTRTTLLNSTQDITKFQISAVVDGPAGRYIYFNGDFIEKNKFGEWENQNGERYWPNNAKTLDFYAWTLSKPATVSSNGIKTLSDCIFRVEGGWYQLYFLRQGKTSSEMYDFCYAISKNTISNLKSSTVTLNFKHALAQVGIKAAINNPSLRVEIKDVSLLNIKEYATFNFGSTTGGKTYWYNWGFPKDVTLDFSKNVNGVTTGKIISMNSDGDSFSKTIVDLTDNDNNENSKNIFLMMPVSSTNMISVEQIIYRKTNSSIPFDHANYTGIRLKCKIWNIADPAKGYQKDSDIQIFGENGEYADLYIPIAFNHEIGKKYIYTISFGNGNAGLDANGNPSIVKLDWSVDSKEWTEGVPEPQTIEM